MTRFARWLVCVLFHRRDAFEVWTGFADPPAVEYVCNWCGRHWYRNLWE